MATNTRFEDLEIGQIARMRSLRVFELTQKEPFFKVFKFRDQIRAAARSAMDNIAEGFERSSKLEFINFLSIARGSSGAIRSQLYSASDQKYIEEPVHQELNERYTTLSSKIAPFIAYLNKSEVKGQKIAGRSK
ncbi:four helix bundle protein [Niabella drilacis]|uniref:Four helix bundle protein n=1 Tax=Niabella drilacis (strain DSM 25811 / CCM 8410 / CCUG 62505 / LMG 26954 / E90) TaxID=1285928 RepID=A0A1G6J066_NIADE|nr:four helix bundle protein [Niabella drilacis]SDC12060.1 four helix bundle protein [Niabella drilacis]